MTVSPVGLRANVPTTGGRPGASPAIAGAGAAQVADGLAGGGLSAATMPQAADPAADQEALRQTFESAFGQTLFGQMLKSMRKTVGKPAYLHGGRGEEVFQRQLDQVLGEKMSRASASQIAGPAFDLFMLQRH
jgi:hypothetical protein